MKPRLFSLLLILALMLSVSTSVFAQGDGPLPDRFAEQQLPVSVSEQKLEQPLELSNFDLGTISGPLFSNGQERVIIRLNSESVAEQKLRGKSAQQAKAQIATEQDDLLSRVLSMDPSATIIAKVQVVLNAVFVEVDAALLPAIASDPAVFRVIPVRDYELNLVETVPYIGSTAVQGFGYDGTGIRVAVLDSGIDYLHAAFGGSGDPAEFAANDPTIIEEGTFPTEKVVGGYDFVGSEWAGSGGPPEVPDPDPLDAGSGGGHGTHVAHIIGGVGGTAPGVDLYAVKVCSSITTSCSGIALIQGMEFAVDPDGDGDPSDHVDVINMSLGANYGNPYDDDLSLAVNNATRIGVLTVAASGNGSDKPYISGTPAAAETALSVAQTSVPSAVLPQIEVLSPTSIAGFYEAVHQSWSAPLDMLLEGPLQYGDGAGGNLLGCSLGTDPNSVDPAFAPYAPGSLAGKIVLVDRGVCNFSIKIHNIQVGGGIAGIIGLVTSEAPFSGAFGAGGPFTIPGFMISQANSIILKSGLSQGEVLLRLDPATGIPLIGTVVGSSSRGPSNNIYNLLKPEIGAPGASVSALAGTGTGEAAFGGTSGATPMVAGSAALLMQAKPGLSPMEVKAQLMNTAFTDVLNEGAGPLAPISRIGGGEVRVDSAFNAPAAAWDDALPTGALSFGFIDVSKDTVNLQKTVRVRNYSNQDITYFVTPSFRYLDDESSGAVTISAPQQVRVKAGKDTTFSVKLTINGALLPSNFMNSGAEGANPGPLTLNEYDGYLTLDDGSQPIHLAWHVLPRKAANVVGRSRLDFNAGMDVVALTNRGVGTAQNDAYSLLAISLDIPEGPMGGQAPTPDIRGVGINTFPVPAGFCSADPSFVWAFAVNTWERQTHLLPVSHQIWLDTNQDGIDDFVVINRDFSGLSTISDGRQLTWALNLATGSATAFFFAEHATNTGNTALYICGEQVGLSGTDLLATNVDMDVVAQDFYFGGPGDIVEGLTVTPLGERFFGIPEDILGKSEGLLTIYDFGLFPGNTPELGLLLFTNGDRGAGNRGGASQETESLFFLAP